MQLLSTRWRLQCLSRWLYSNPRPNGSEPRIIQTATGHSEPEVPSGIRRRCPHLHS
jgi:hypothetical protein